VTSPEVVTIISALSVAVIQVLVALRQGGKLDVIHELTNSNLAAVKTALVAANARIERLEGLLTARKENS
jgi:hypothetical protein